MLPKDDDAHREVFLLIYGPRTADATTRDLSWSLTWKITPDVWRHVVLELYTSYDAGPEPTLRYMYAGGETTRITGAMQEARACSLGRMSLRQRAQIEELAKQVGVCRPTELWSCQEWTKGVLVRMADAGIIPQRVREDALEFAANAWRDVISGR